jgi:hypothetical protein
MTGAPKGRFFPDHSEGDWFVRSDYLGVLVWEPVGNDIEYYTGLGLISRTEGFARIVDAKTGAVIGQHVFGTRRSWRFDYEEVVDHNGVLADRADGVGTQAAQLVQVLLVRSCDLPYYGSFEQDGVRVLFSGAQSFQDVNICHLIWTRYNIGHSHHKANARNHRPGRRARRGRPRWPHRGGEAVPGGELLT